MIRSKFSPIIRSMFRSMIGTGDALIQRIFIELQSSSFTIENPIVSTGDFKHSFKFQIKDLSSFNNTLLSSNDVTDDFLRLDVANGGFDWKIDGEFKTNDGAFVADKLLHEGVMERVGSRVTIELDGEIIIDSTTPNNLGNFTVAAIGRRDATPNFFEGVIADVALDNGTVNSWDIKEATANTEANNEGGNNLTYNDVTVGSRELFTKVNDDWLGLNLVINGGFDNGLTGWDDTSETNASIAVINNVLEMTSAGAASGDRARVVNSVSMATFIDSVYRLESNQTIGGLNVRGGSTSQNNNILGDQSVGQGDALIDFVTDFSAFYANFYGQAASTVGLDDILFRRLLEVPWIGDQIAHRGFLDDSPENTLAAYTDTLAVDVKHLECDVRLTSDGEYVLLHDGTIDRTSNNTGDIDAITFATVRTYDFGSWFNIAFAGEQIPSFDEFCIFADTNNCTIYPEIKSSMSNAEISGMIDIIVNNNLVNSCVIQSFNHADLDVVRGINSSITLGYLSSSLVSPSSMLSNSYALVNKTAILADLSYIKTIHNAGLKVAAFTVTIQNDYDTLVRNDIDGIMTNTKFTET